MVDLNKRTETAAGSLISLMKEQADKGVDLGEVSAQVVLVMDYSGSMTHLYNNGSVQDVAEKALAMSLTGLDDDGTVPVHFFHHQALKATSVTAATYSGFVDSWTRGKSMGGTNYAGVIKNVINDATSSGGLLGRFGKKASGPAKVPTLVLFVTDGEPSDQSETMQLLQEAADLPIFWQFLGLGYEPRFLKQLDTMGGRTVDNVGLAQADNIGDEAAWFRTALEEFVTSWLPAARAAGIVA